MLEATGVRPELVRLGHTLTYAQAVHAAKTGVLPDNTLVQPELAGLVGRVIVISLNNNVAAVCLLRVRDVR